jgi:CRP/FNR family cyclic AMP-dependent transcriptional regulator
MTGLQDQVSLLDARPELVRHLTPDERAEVLGVSLPVITAGPGYLPLDELLNKHKAFGATVVDGLVMGSLRIGRQSGTHLLGPGDLLRADSEVWPAWLGDLEFRTAAPVQLGLFGNELLLAVHRWPRIVQGLYASVGDQLHRLTAQLVICQLPRVEDRVLALLWLLAETWGHVTPGGVRLPLTLTHETLGGLIGARRPTVTLALRKLTDEGSLVPQESGWLLLKSPPVPEEAAGPIAPAAPPEPPLRPWAQAEPLPEPAVAYAELLDTVQRLREEHRSERALTLERLEEIRTSRARMLASRRLMEQHRFRRPLPPSS